MVKETCFSPFTPSHDYNLLYEPIFSWSFHEEKRFVLAEIHWKIHLYSQIISVNPRNYIDNSRNISVVLQINTVVLKMDEDKVSF